MIKNQELFNVIQIHIKFLNILVIQIADSFFINAYRKTQNYHAQNACFLESQFKYKINSYGLNMI